jgi:hypothetical protein
LATLSETASMPVCAENIPLEAAEMIELNDTRAPPS